MISKVSDMSNKQHDEKPITTFQMSIDWSSDLEIMKLS